ncbi:hypothetical protein A9Q97_06195 [Rhodospirillales bacterium 47_12_T64]|nr:hypothetical protein A9Q97_06195 [Rhodospirillales bacterium 47_12_T64]
MLILKRKNPHNSKRVEAQKRGKYAEQLASWFLRFKGYQILVTNYKTSVGEIDLIAKRGNVLCFIEVKKRASKSIAAHAISSKQKARIIRASELYLKQNSNYQILGKRFDAILIGATVIPYHITNAWQSN